MKLLKGEIKLREVGLTIPVPMNLMILLTNVECDVLNVIRHAQGFQEKYISDSVIRIQTGHTKRSIKQAKESLASMGIIKIKEITRRGTEYEILYGKLCQMIRDLNKERSPCKRLEMADVFRGEGKAINTGLINEYKGTNFDKCF
jgi:hypothetical protein